MTSVQRREVEEYISSCIKRGEVADLTSQPGYDPENKPVVHASFIRGALLGFGGALPGLAGVRVIGAAIEGTLDLADLAFGSGLPPLQLEQCDLPDLLVVSHARLARLSLLQSRVVGVVGIGTHILGSADFGGVRPISDQSPCYIRLRQARVDGTISFRGDTRLVAPNEPHPLSSRPADALELQFSIVGGGVLMDQGFSAKGAVWLLGAQIAGNLECDGGHFENPGKTAIQLGGAKISGSVHLRERNGIQFASLGKIDLNGATIEGSVESRGARLINRGGAAISAEKLTCNGSVVLCSRAEYRFQAEGSVNFQSARVAVDFNCDGAHLENDGKVAIQAANMKVGGNLLMRATQRWRFEANGGVSLLGVQVGANLEATGGRFVGAGSAALQMGNSDVRGSVYLRANAHARFEAEGAVTLNGARIGKSLDCSAGRFSNADATSLSAENVSVGGTLDLSDGALGAFESFGVIRLAGSKIARDIDCRGAVFCNAGGTAFYASAIEVEGNVLFQSSSRGRFQSDGGIWLIAAKINQTLACQEARIVNKGGLALTADNAVIGAVLLRGGTTHKFEAEGTIWFLAASIRQDFELHSASLQCPGGLALCLQTATIGGRLAVRDNVVQGAVSLAGARVARLFDDPITGWGAPDAPDQVGVSEIVIEQIGTPKAAARPPWRGRAKWLLRNTGIRSGERGAFSNQPWRQVAGAYQRAGDYRGARNILREEQREANRHRSIIVQPFVWLFGEQMFGFGLSALRATISMLIVWAIGAVGTTTMVDRGILEFTHPSAMEASACIQAVPALYALDVMIPILDLGEENKCEIASSSQAHRLPSWIQFDGADLSLDEALLWRWAKALYAILGALVVSFALLTFSGVFRPKIETAV